MENMRFNFLLIFIAIALVGFFFSYIGIAPLTGHVVDISAGDSYVNRSITPDSVQFSGVVTINLEVNVQAHTDEDFYFVDELVPSGFTVLNAGGGNQDESGHLKWIYIADYGGDVGNATSTTYTYNLTAPNGPATGIFNGTFGFASNPESVNGTTDEFILGETTATILAGDNPPVINSGSIVPNGPQIYNYGDSLTIGADVTDDNSVSSVVAVVTYPNSTTQSLTLSAVGDFYSVSYTIPDLDGQYNVAITATDGVNSPVIDSTSFSVAAPDIQNPVITGDSGDVTLMVGASSTLWITGTDDVAVTSAQVTIDSGSAISMTWNSTSSRWEYTYTAPSNDATDHTYQIVIYDAAVNNAVSSLRNIVVNDNNPSVLNFVPSAGSSFDFGDTITISTDATDDLSGIGVVANISFPNGTLIQTLTLTNSVGDIFTNTFVVPSVSGTYAIDYTATDSSSNTATGSTNFIASNPILNLNLTLNNLIPVEGTIFNPGNTITISIDAQDNVSAIDRVYVDLVYPNETSINLNLSNSSDIYSTAFVVPSLGIYNLTFVANNTLGGIKTSKTSFVVNVVVATDSDPPGSGGGGPTGTNYVTDPVDDSLKEELSFEDNALPQEEFIFADFIYRTVFSYDSNDTLGVELIEYDASGIATETIAYYKGYNLQGNLEVVEGLIYFKVAIEWMNERGLDSDSIVLFSLINDEWKEVTTGKISQDDGYVYFSSKVKNLGPVAITGKVVEAEPISLDIIKIILVVVGALILVVAILLVVRYVKKKKQQSLTIMPGSNI